MEGAVRTAGEIKEDMRSKVASLTQTALFDAVAVEGLPMKSAHECSSVRRQRSRVRAQGCREQKLLKFDLQDRADMFSQGCWELDAGFPESERLPRQFCVEFKAVTKGGQPAIQLLRNGAQIGDILTDNAHLDDGYRYHDVFHFAHAAVLGWSPMVRRLFECKRKSDPRKDEVEDGARAKILEEATCAIVFEYARAKEFLAGAVAVDRNVIQNVRAITRNYEVKVRSFFEWESAILQSYRVWRQMRENEGGILIGNLKQRRIDYRPCDR